MTTPKYVTRCSRHHNACDCREYKFTEMEKQLISKSDKLQIALAALKRICSNAQPNITYYEQILKDGTVIPDFRTVVDEALKMMGE